MALPVWLSSRWIKGRGARKGRQGERLVACVLGQLRSRDGVVLNDIMLPSGRERTVQIDHIVVASRGVFVIETKSLSGQITGTAAAKIRAHVCPRCGGELRVHRGSFGEFVGCANYPECRFTCSIDHLHN